MCESAYASHDEFSRDLTYFYVAIDVDEKLKCELRIRILKKGMSDNLNG